MEQSEAIGGKKSETTWHKLEQFETIKLERVGQIKKVLGQMHNDMDQAGMLNVEQPDESETPGTNWRKLQWAGATEQAEQAVTLPNSLGQPGTALFQLLPRPFLSFQLVPTCSKLLQLVPDISKLFHLTVFYLVPVSKLVQACFSYMTVQRHEYNYSL